MTIENMKLRGFCENNEKRPQSIIMMIPKKYYYSIAMNDI